MACRIIDLKVLGKPHLFENPIGVTARDAVTRRMGRMDAGRIFPVRRKATPEAA